jgi:regulatory protein
MDQDTKSKSSFQTQVEILRRYCAFQERTVEDVRLKALKLDMNAGETDNAVSILKDEGYIDEARFLKAYINGKINYNQWGKRKIREQLRLKKIDNQLIDKALKEIDQTLYQSMLMKVVQKKVKLMKVNDKEKMFSSLMRYALSKGFEHDMTMKVVNEIIERNDF